MADEIVIPDHLKDRACTLHPNDGHVAVLTPQFTHYAKLVCARCEGFITWIPKPTTAKARRPSSHRELVARFGRGFCEMCLIKEVDIPPGETLEGHHVIEFANGGSEERDNIWIVCTACHKLIHWRRTYLDHLLLKVAQSIANRQSEEAPPW